MRRQGSGSIITRLDRRDAGRHPVADLRRRQAAVIHLTRVRWSWARAHRVTDLARRHPHRIFRQGVGSLSGRERAVPGAGERSQDSRSARGLPADIARPPSPWRATVDLRHGHDSSSTAASSAGAMDAAAGRLKGCARAAGAAGRSHFPLPDGRGRVRGGASVTAPALLAHRVAEPPLTLPLLRNGPPLPAGARVLRPQCRRQVAALADRDLVEPQPRRQQSQLGTSASATAPWSIPASPCAAWTSSVASPGRPEVDAGDSRRRAGRQHVVAVHALLDRV